MHLKSAYWQRTSHALWRLRSHDRQRLRALPCSLGKRDSLARIPRRRSNHATVYARFSHRLLMRRRGLPGAAEQFVPHAQVRMGAGSRRVPAKSGRRGRRALFHMPPCRENRRSALPKPPRPLQDSPQQPEGRVAYMLKLPRVLRSARCRLARYISSRMSRNSSVARAR